MKAPVLKAFIRSIVAGAGFSLCLLSTSFAQNVGRIAGTVTDAETGDPLPGANVVITSTMQGAAADVDGSYFILNIPPGRYEIRASMIGYETTVMVDVVVNAARTTTTKNRGRPPSDGAGPDSTSSRSPPGPFTTNCRSG